MPGAAFTPPPEGERCDTDALPAAGIAPAPAWLLARAREARLGAGAVPSPCISVCRMDPKTTLCEGCYRTMDEICQWAQATDTDKRQVWARIAQRAAPEAV
ncbi:DUF1289 domain-containing protein [Rhodoferax sp.]|uniref:DUF1289 domain-containing protein n=1 Tax=Rhodoferax sp. TaxID=50421 RepID=UPI003782DE5B